MKYYTTSILLLGALSSVWAYPTNDSETAAKYKFAQFDQQYQTYLAQTLQAQNTGCTPENIVYRREWGTLSQQERLDYVEAVECLQSKPPRSDPAVAPGVRSRYDDFVARHIQLTPNVHFSGIFLSFHRYFTWTYEKALQDECGYNGTQPYWDWTLEWQDPTKSTVFDGSPYSMGSNGQSIPHGNTTISAFGLTLSMPPGTGGGCVYSGPFTSPEYNVTLGPVAYQPYGPDHGLGPNPRCLTRDLNPIWSNNTRPSSVVSLLEACTDVGCFDTVLEALNGVHAGGHFTMGGLGIDAYASAGDPVFFLHHSMVDRMWTIWQAQNAANRTMQTAQTETAFNTPPSPNVTLSTIIDMGVLGPSKQVGDLVSPLSGPFCYGYI